MRIAVIFLLAVVMASCGLNDAELEKTIAQKVNAKECTISERGDINDNKPKILLVEITEPQPDNFDLDLQIVASRIAVYIVDSTQGDTYKGVKEINVRYYLKKDTSEYTIRTADVHAALKYISRATQFVKAFAGLDTLTTYQLMNYRFVMQDDVKFSMETPNLQRDTFGNISSVKFLGFTSSIVERNATDVYEVRFALFRQHKVTELYQVLIDKRDTLVVGYSWQFPTKR